MPLLDDLFNIVSLNFKRTQVVLQIKHGIPGYKDEWLNPTNIFTLPKELKYEVCVLVWEKREYFVMECPSSHAENVLARDLWALRHGIV